MNKIVTSTALAELISKIKSTFIGKTDTVEVTAIDVDTTPTVGSSNLVTSGGVANAIPTNTSDLINDSGFITEDDIPDIPTKTSDLTNDSGFITAQDVPASMKFVPGVESWHDVTVGDNLKLRSIVFGNGKFVAYISNSLNIATSTDGINWTIHENVLASKPDSSGGQVTMFYANNTYFLFSTNFTSVCVSTDGITWRSSSLPTGHTWTTIAYGNGKYVIGSADAVAYSTDAASWTVNTNAYGMIAFGNGKFVLLSTSTAFYSTDGVNWSTAQIPSDRTYRNIIFGGNKFVVTVNGRYFIYSTDGVTWSDCTKAPSSCDYRSVAYGDGIYVAIPYDTYSRKYSAVSYDGINWNTVTTVTAKNNLAIAYGNGKFVAVANTTTYSYYSKETNKITQSDQDITDDILGKLKVGNTIYSIAISTTDAPQPGKIVFVVEA